jgi:hypothetical protein
LAVHHPAWSRHGQIKRYDRTYEAANPTEPTKDTDSQLTKDRASGPFMMNGGTS